MKMYRLALLSLAFAGSALISTLGACVPAEQSGSCDVDEDCTGRGDVCDSLTHQCVDSMGDHSSTQNPAPTDFTGMEVAFFRGKVCTARNGEATTGTQIPLSFNPCLHPCLSVEPGSPRYQHQWSCTGGECNGISLWTGRVNGSACPADAFSKFDASMCDYSVQTEAGSLGPVVLGGDPIQAVVYLEIPFLTNDDAAAIAAFSNSDASDECQSSCAGDSSQNSCLKSCFIRELAESYRLENDRVINLNIRDDSPAPAASCENQADCTCYDIGFE